MIGSCRDTVVGIDLGGSVIKAGLVTVSRRGDGIPSSGPTISARVQVPTERFAGKKRIMEQLLQCARAVLSSTLARPTGVGLAVPGTVETDTGTLVSAPLLPGWQNEPIGQRLEQELGLRVVIENDTNAAAFAEATWGASAEFRSSAYLTVSTGLGMGVVFDKKVYRGAYGLCGEFSHIPIWPGGATCESGHLGCAEAYVTGAAIATRARSVFGRAVTTADVFAYAAQGDQRATTIINDSIHYLSLIVRLVQTMIDPDVFVLGGGVANGQPQLVQMIESHYVHIATYPAVTPTIRRAHFGSSASLIGAAAVCRDVMDP